MTFLLDIVTPTRKAFSQQVEAVTVPAPTGAITVLSRHMPLFTMIGEGEIKIVMDGKEYYLAIGGGFMEVIPSGVSILLSRALHAHELNETDIEKAKKAAQEVLAEQAKGTERAAAQAVVRRSLLELKVLERMRHKASAYSPRAS